MSPRIYIIGWTVLIFSTLAAIWVWAVRGMSQNIGAATLLTGTILVCCWIAAGILVE